MWFYGKVSMNKDTGSHDLAPKDSGTEDVGARAIDFGTGEASGFPKDYSAGRPDAEACYSEFGARNGDSDVPLSQPSVYNTGGLCMNISSKDNGGSGTGK